VKNRYCPAYLWSSGAPTSCFRSPDLAQVKDTVPEPGPCIVVLDDIIEGSVLQQVDGGAHILLAGDQR